MQQHPQHPQHPMDPQQQQQQHGGNMNMLHMAMHGLGHGHGHGLGLGQMPPMQQLQQQVQAHQQCAADPYRLQVLERRVDMLERMMAIQQQANDAIMQLSSLQRAPVGLGLGLGLGGGPANAAAGAAQAADPVADRQAEAVQTPSHVPSSRRAVS